MKNYKGITLIALVVTIIILLILAGVTIATLTGENGILTRASDAKIETAVGAVKEALKLEQGEKVINNEKLTPEILLSEGKVLRTVQTGENDTYYMYYVIKENAYEGMQGLGKGNIASLKDVFLIDDKLNVKYIASNGKEYGDNLENKVLEDETEIRFASKAFSKYVSNISGVTEDEMKFKWMKNQTELTISDPQVDSLQDLAFFPNLVKLQLGTSGNNNNSPQVTSMDGIENCTKLTTLQIYYGPDKDYSAVSNLKNLNSFFKQTGTDFENIINGLKDCKELRRFDLRSMLNISNMKRISELANLESLIVRGANITEIEGLENQTNLRYLDLSLNSIAKIEGLENLTNLESLILSDNQIIDITPLATNSKLTSLDLRGNEGIDGNRNNYTGDRLEKLNKISEILDKGGNINLDIDKLGLFTNYKNLNLSGQKLENLEKLEGLTELKTLILGFNNITLGDLKSQKILKSMTNLEQLDLSYNKISTITPVNSLENLTHLYLNNNDGQVNLKEIEDIISNLSVLHISTESLETISQCDKNKITKLNLMGSGLTEIPDLSEFNSLTKFNLQNSPDVLNFNEISKITSLNNLTLKNNNLHGRMIDFSKLTNLTSLNLSNNTLWDEDLENLKALKNKENLTIDLSNNSIINATALLELNSNTRINLSGNLNLTKEAKEELKGHFQERVTF